MYAYPVSKELNTWRAYYLKHSIELVSPYLQKEERVSLLDSNNVDKWKLILENISSLKPIQQMVCGSTMININLPKPLHHIVSSGKKWYLGNARVAGITSAIGRHLQRFRRQRKSHRRYCGNCLRIGIDVDKELKDFAVGKIGYDSLKYDDSRMILEHLWELDMSLVSSAVLVCNWIENARQKHLSGTEIDLIGFDHNNRCLVVIEIKITSTSFQELIREHKRAKRDKRSGFKKCLLGRYIAQVVCTLKMYERTYKSEDVNGLLVICEHRNSKPYSLKLCSKNYDDSVFQGWLPGF